MAIILPLIHNAAFMKCTLEDLQDLIQRDGVVDYYQNGANQSGLKQSAALQSYNSLIKNYAAVLKSLCEYLPRSKRAAFTCMMPERTPEEDAEDLRRSVERADRINAEIAAAAEKQRLKREKEVSA